MKNLSSHAHLMNQLKAQLNRIKLVLPAGSKIIYYNFPLQLNVGDLLIYVAAIEFFKNSNLELVGIYSDKITLSQHTKGIDGETIIVLNGGGNLGDLYPHHQVFKEDIVKLFPNNRIVILPQSIYFADASNQQESAMRMKTHQDCHIFCRDKESYETAKKFSNYTYLMPDMAHYLWKGEFVQTLFRVEKPPSDQLLFLDRTDSEKVNYSAIKNNLSNFETFDWSDALPKYILWTCALLCRLSRVCASRRVQKGIHVVWLNISKHCIRLCARKLNSYSECITTRLHGHILAMLISKRHKTLDNNYGKLINYRHAWTSGSDRASKMTDTDVK